MISRNVKQTYENRLKQLRLNWILTFLLGIHMSVSYILFYSTLHNFIVNPASNHNETCRAEEEENPGLGGSEVEYSVAVSLGNAGGLFGSVFALTIAKNCLSFKKIVVLIPIINGIGFVFYGIGLNTWMIMIGRFMSGIAIGWTLIVMMWYYVSSTEEYNHLQSMLGKPNTSNLKRKLSATFGLLTTFAYIPLSCLVTLIAQFPDIDQFRWPGWFNVAFSCLTALINILLFKDEALPSGKEYKFSHLSTLFKLRFNRKNFKLKDVLVMIFLIYTGSMIDAGLQIIETITSPVLSDYFGFDVTKITYFVFGLTALFPLSCLFLLLLERLRISSRWTLLFALVLNTSGLVLISDWQYLDSSNDICGNYSVLYEAASSNSECINEQSCVGGMNAKYCFANETKIIYYRDALAKDIQQGDCQLCTDDEQLDESCIALKLYNDELCLITQLEGTNDDIYSICLYSHDNGADNLTKTFPFDCNPDAVFLNDLFLDVMHVMNISQNSFTSVERQFCEFNDECYWNPQSIVTGDYCKDCPKLCRNKKKSLSFTQVCIGLGVLTFSIEMARYTSLPMLSNLVSSNMKLYATCFYVLSGTVSRLVTPLWFNTIYVATGRLTVLPCLVLLTMEVPIYFGFMIFICSHRCKQLGTTRNTKQETDHGPEESQTPAVVAKNPIFDNKNNIN